MKTIARCGGKKSGCCADIILPYGVAPEKISDNNITQSEATGGTKTSTSK